jgi:hypothetical protein
MSLLQVNGDPDRLRRDMQRFANGMGRLTCDFFIHEPIPNRLLERLRNLGSPGMFCAEMAAIVMGHGNISWFPMVP